MPDSGIEPRALTYWNAECNRQPLGVNLPLHHASTSGGIGGVAAIGGFKVILILFVFPTICAYIQRFCT